jgi:hypothetical protein
MGVIASLDSTSVTADPGGETSCSIRVRNTGKVVDQVLVDVIGDAQPWSTVEPAQLNLLPGTDAVARVVFRPPRSGAVPAGMVPFAVRAMSQEDPDGSTIEEGTVEVNPFFDLKTVLVPGTARGRRQARYQIVVENEGNTPVHAAVSVADPDRRLEFRVKPETLVTQPGTATFVRLQAVPKERFLRGPDRTLPFQVLLHAAEFAPATVNGVMVHRQVMPKWLLPVIGVTAAALAGAVVLWTTMLKPQVHSVATQGAAAVAQQQTSSVAKASKATPKAHHTAQQTSPAAGVTSRSAIATGKNGSASSGTGSTGTGSTGAGSTGAASTGAGSAGAASTGAASTGAASTGTPGTSGTGGSSTASATAAPTTGTPISSSLQSDASPSATYSTVPYAVPANETLDVSDIVFKNPQGDTGELQIRAGSKTLVQLGLATIPSSLDDHFVQPLVFTTAAPLVLAVECQNSRGKACADKISFSGVLTKGTSSPSPGTPTTGTSSPSPGTLTTGTSSASPGTLSAGTSSASPGTLSAGTSSASPGALSAGTSSPSPGTLSAGTSSPSPAP